jgi:hypothetical protein
LMIKEIVVVDIFNCLAISLSANRFGFIHASYYQ